MRRLNSATLFAAAEFYRKRLLRSVPICDSSHRSLSSAGGFGVSRKPYQRKKRLPLPAELSASGNVAELTCESAARGGFCHVYLIGTSHYSQTSCEEVKAMVEFVQPRVVFLELCHLKACALESAREGGEFYVANKAATKYGASVILGDLPLEIILGRIRTMTCLWELLVSLPNLIHIMIKKSFKEDELAPSTRGLSNLALDKLERTLPYIYETIVNERDRYMSAKLLDVACQHNSVVAVVGMSHLRGIQKYWKEPVDIEQLLHTPTRSRVVMCIRFCMLNLVLKLVLILLKAFND